MACSLKDIRFTVRRVGDGTPTIYPRLLRDQAMVPKVRFAIDYFESLVGHERRELDGELLVNFFGDHKLARCVVAALAQTYRFRARRIAEVVSKRCAARLVKQGIAAPKLLRLALFDDVNERRDGFTSPAERETAHADLANRLGVRAADVERVLYLDLDEHAVLCRVGARPSPDDVIAQSNFGILETLLRHAEQIDLTPTSRTPAMQQTIRNICTAHSVTATLDGADGGLRLCGRQDALGNWSRHGRKLSRATLEVLECGRSAMVSGQAALQLPNRQVSLRLTDEVLDVLAGPHRAVADWHDDVGERAGIVDTIISQVHQDHGERSIRRFPEARAGHAAVILPDLLVRSATDAALICAVRSVQHGERLSRLAKAQPPGEPLVFVGAKDHLAPLQDPSLLRLALEQFDLLHLDALLKASRTAVEIAPLRKRA